MKKLLILSFAVLTGLSVFAAAPAAKPAEPEPAPLDQWTFFQIGLFPGIPAATRTSNVYGIKSGWPICNGYGRVFGLEVSWLLSGTAYAYGIQASWVSCWTKEFGGIQAAFLYTGNTVRFDGIQATLGVAMAGDFNGLEASALNISGNATGLQAAATVNVSGDVTGFQTCVLVNVAKDVTGLQIAGVNKAVENTGLQVGIVNVAKHGGVQLGLVNYIKESAIPFFPILNICF